MGKMFKTIYPQSVDNDNLLKIGEMRIGINPSNNVTEFYISIYDGHSKKSVKNGYITDEAGNVNNGNTSNDVRVFLSPSSTALIIDNKYKLNQLHVLSNHKNVSIDLSDLRYTNTMNVLILPDVNISGSLSDISNMINLTNLILSGDISGSLSDISNMTKIIELRLSSKNISGDLSELPVTLKMFSCYGTIIGGKLSSLKNIINLTSVSVSNYVTGDISDIDSLTKLKNLMIPSTITHTDAQVKALQDKGVTVIIY